MKKIIIITLFIFTIISCSSNNEESVVQESTQIINDYVDTLEGSIQNSKDVKKLIENNQEKLQNSINSIR